MATDETSAHVGVGTAPTAPRDTRQRRAVLAALGQTGSFRSAQAIHTSIRQTGEKIGLATVYRALKMLSDSGEVDVVRDDTGEQLYRRCGTSHHHHLVCVSCGTAVEVESAPMERWAVKVGEAHGFSDVWHSLEVFGTCAPCAGGAELAAGDAAG
jgi:Fur family transcriptional regulator, ferric uptake regulator